MNTLCEPSNVPEHNDPNITVKPKYSSGEIWALTAVGGILAGIGAAMIAIAVIAAIAYAAEILLAIAGSGGVAAFGGMMITLGYIIGIAGTVAAAGGAAGAINKSMTGATSTIVSLPAVGSVCYAGDQRLYEGTFNPAAAALEGESALRNYAIESFGYFKTIDMESQTSYDGSGNVTSNANAYVNEIINFNNLTNHSIDKDPSGNGIYYKGY
jgi:hypothetical protein